MNTSGQSESYALRIKKKKKTYACYYIKIIPYVLSRLMATTGIKKKKCSNCSHDPWKVWVRDKKLSYF